MRIPLGEALRWALMGLDERLGATRAYQIGLVSEVTTREDLWSRAHQIAATVDYTATRCQFGVPVGSYQALKHHVADALLLLEHARPAVYRAAWSVATGQATRGRDVSMARVMADRAAARAARVALQCHGAIGYTWEHDLHLWLKRVWVLERAWGTTAHHRARVAAAVVGAEAESSLI